jgi:DNA polymerase-3 subunit delta'
VKKVSVSEPMQLTIFPWQAGQWQQLLEAKQQNRLPHAFLFAGIEGIGKRQFAHVFANLMLCVNITNSMVCGACTGCHLFAAKTHPDFVLVEPEEAVKAINVDQIRSIIKMVNETTVKGGYRVILINPATAMNVNAANALLKTLEEPTANTVIILICHQSLRLPATIISRCQKILFPKPSQQESLNWLREQFADDKIDPQLLLKLSDGAPLRALAWLKEDLFLLRNELYQGLHSLSEGKADPLLLAAKWQDADQVCVVDLLLSWLTDLLRFKMTQDQATLVNADYQAIIAKISVSLLKNNLLAYIDHLQQARSFLSTSINLNKQLLLEDIFIRWTEYVSS